MGCVVHYLASTVQSCGYTGIGKSVYICSHGVTGDCARQNATLLHVAPFKENPSSFLVDENIYRKSTVKKVNLQGFLLINSVQFL